MTTRTSVFRAAIANVTAVLAAFTLSTTAFAQATSCTSTTITINGVSSTTLTGSCSSFTTTTSSGTGVGDVSLVVPMEVWVSCTETVREVSPESVNETLESIEACILADHQEGEKILGPAAQAIAAFATTFVLRYAPAAYGALTNLLAGYSNGSRPLTAEARNRLARELVSFLRQKGFICPSSTNPFTCVRIRGDGVIR